MTRFCVLTELDSCKWWCRACDPDKSRLLRCKAIRRCRSHTERPPPIEITPEDIAERTFACGMCPTKRNIDGHCVRKTCGGVKRRIAIDKLCREARGCPEYHW